MTYPQMPQAPAAPQYPQQPQAAPVGYPPAPTYPQAPEQHLTPPPYAPQQPQYSYPQAPQQYGGYPQQPPAPPVPAGPPPTLADFYKQPSTGWGPALSWKGKQIGHTFVGIVGRELTEGDVEVQTSPSVNGQPGVPLHYKDGRPKLLMRVPLLVQPSAEHPEGKAQWYVKGADRDELGRAMAEVGAPAGPPEKGATVAITWASERSNAFGTMSKIVQVRYQRPQGAAPAPQAAPPAPVAQVPAQQTAPVVSTATGVPVVHQQAIPQQPPAAPAPQVQQQAAPPAAVPPPAGDASGLDPERAALLAQLTGQAAG